VRVACGQFELKTDLKANLEKIEDYLERAGKAQVDLIVFPELALTGYPPRDCTSLDFVDQDRTQAALARLRQRAGDLGVALAVGTAWREPTGGWRNRAYFIDQTGEILAQHDKIQQTQHERQFFQDGEKLESFLWRDIRVGMLICAEMRYPELWRLLRKDGVALVSHLAAAFGKSEWKVPVLEGTLRCRAATNGYHVVSCNNAGPIPMVISAIYNPDGLILAKANYAVEEMIFCDIELGKPKGYVDFKDNVYRLQRSSSQ